MTSMLNARKKRMSNLRGGGVNPQAAIDTEEGSLQLNF